MASKKNPRPIIYTEKALAKMLDMSISGLQNYRYAGLIDYIQSKDKGKVFYHHQHFVDFCERFTKRGNKTGQ